MTRTTILVAASAMLTAAVACSEKSDPLQPVTSSSGAGGSTSTGSNIASRWLQIDSATSERLNAVWAIAENDVWAAGDGVIVHYDGFDWVAVEAGDLPSGSNTVDWKGVTATGPDDVWVTGSQSDDDGPAFLHYDGEGWSSVVNKDDAVAGESYILFGIASTDGGVWIADGSLGQNDAGHGYFYDGDVLEDRVDGEMRSVAVAGSQVFFGMDGGQVMHYDGAEWSMPEIDDLGLGDVLVDVFAVSEGDVWAVGPEKRVHFDGSAWTLEKSPSEAYGVWGAASDDVWLVGDAIEHYDGSTWTVGVPPVDVTYRGIHGTGAEDVWAVGDEGTILHFSG